VLIINQKIAKLIFVLIVEIKLKNNMKIEELLSARYEVIADYPQSMYEVGYVIHESMNLEGKKFFTTEVHKYPHIFKKLDWFKDRKESEMPEYLKFVWGDKIDEIRKVKSWLYGDESESWKPIKERKLPHVINGFTYESDFDKEVFPRVSLNGWLPATKEEYNEFIKQKLM
jgi:hypothetical protein